MIAGILLGIAAGLLANEFCDLTPWCARKIVRWSAFRRYADPGRAEVRAEELTAVINDRPGNLFKLITAVSFAVGAIIVAGRRAAAQDSDAGATPVPFPPASLTETLPASVDRAVTELYSQHYRALVRLAALLVRDTPTAEEVVQDSFIALHRGWDRLRDAENAPAYLRQAVVNRSRSVLRHRVVVDKSAQKAPPDMPSDAEYGALAELERSAVVAALRKLPDRQREAIMLRYYEGLYGAEIAARMGISRGAVKSLTARGMSALRAALEHDR